MWIGEGLRSSKFVVHAGELIELIGSLMTNPYAMSL